MENELTKVAYIFPGQGAQWVGMGHDLYRNYDVARAVFEQADEVLSFPISRLCFEGPEDELRQTVNAQPAILTVSLACLRVMDTFRDDRALPLPAFVAGHSLGEYTALATAGVLDFATAVRLARQRGRLMHEAGLKRAGGMVAIIGLGESALAEICRETDTRIANINCPGQLVISGAKENLTKAADLAAARGARRTVALAVSGAFHTPLMQSAADGMAEVIADIPFRDPLIPVIANTTAEPLTTVEMVKEELLRQLCHGIDWQHSIEYMVEKEVSTFFEIGPGKVLSGLVKRIDGNVKTINMGDAEAIKSLVG